MHIYNGKDWILLLIVTHLLSLKNKKGQLNSTHINCKKILSRQVLSLHCCVHRLPESGEHDVVEQGVFCQLWLLIHFYSLQNVAQQNKAVTWCLVTSSTVMKAPLQILYTGWNICHFNCTGLKHACTIKSRLNFCTAVWQCDLECRCTWDTAIGGLIF